MVLPNLVAAPDPNKPVRVRLLSPLGLYPRHAVLLPRRACFSLDDLVVSAVKTASEAVNGLGIEHHSDHEMLALEEIRFLAALALSVHPDDGTVLPIPSTRTSALLWGLTTTPSSTSPRSTRDGWPESDR